MKKGAVPVLFEWNSYSLPATRPSVWDRTERPNTPDLPDDEEPVMEVDCHDHDYCYTTEPAAVDLALGETEELRSKLSKLRREMEEMAISCKFGLERFASSDDDIRFYTRFASYAHLMSFWSQIESAVHAIVRVTRARAVTKADDVRQAVNPTSLQPIDEFFLFMTYLSLGLLQKDLAHRFGIHQSTVSRIINTWANFLYNVLGAVGIWLDEKTIREKMPEVFHQYPDTYVILDCTELRCQTPDSLLLQSEVFSSYKSHSTFKGLIGIAPHGPVMFVSPLYEGSISDREILKQSGLISLLNPSMAIMVDKGFLVEDIVPCRVHIPAFLKKKTQLSGPEVRKTQSIARLRVHVERIIRRVKEHKLFSTVIPLSLTGSINQLFAVACILVNYQNGPLVKAWATKS
ncbi:hypothetical protein ROHU_001174 [Labeo rohita]|uniref:THAP domain-containing 3 n=1 Tax=Labeo rohita TaxID=84645 RepID=A0A498P2T5_LABRO|nr:hypothetical protein ROHU_001174 [Labeo rohita]